MSKRPNKLFILDRSNKKIGKEDEKIQSLMKRFKRNQSIQSNSIQTNQKWIGLDWMLHY